MPLHLIPWTLSSWVSTLIKAIYPIVELWYEHKKHFLANPDGDNPAVALYSLQNLLVFSLTPRPISYFSLPYTKPSTALLSHYKKGNIFRLGPEYNWLFEARWGHLIPLLRMSNCSRDVRLERKPESKHMPSKQEQRRIERITLRLWISPKSVCRIPQLGDSPIRNYQTTLGIWSIQQLSMSAFIICARALNNGWQDIQV